MGFLDKINDIKAIGLLENYNGGNPYIMKFKKKLIKDGKLTLTDNQSKYIVDNHDREPVKIDKIVRISNYLGEELKKSDELSFVPEKILIEYILADNDKTFHIYGKLTRKQEKGKLYWLPKTQVLDDPYFDEIDVSVDFDKYQQLDKNGRVPFEHQKEAIKFLLGRNSSILALDMGLGKTFCAIVAALESGAERILIISPSSLKINWEREIKCFCNETAIVEGKKWKRAKFTIINYDILKNFHTIPKARKKKDLTDLIVGNREIVNSNFDLCIIDEAHYIKDPKTIRGKLINDICLKNTIKRVWLLTGTPMANRPMDYFNLLALIKSPIANNWVFYAKRYCDAKRFYKTLKNGKTKQIWITDGASNLDELSNKTRNLVLRRRKEDVLDMPDKIITPLCYELTPSERNEYNELWEAYIEKRKSLGLKVNLQKDLVELILLRKYIAMKAIPKTIELAESCIEQGQKVVIFTNFTDELMELHNYFGKSSVIHYGDYNNAQKQYSVDKFQTDPNVNVFIGNVKSAGVGITLTAGNIVIFNSYDWVPGQNDQCEDRCHRIGQKLNVTVYYQLFLNSISIRVWETLQTKKAIIAKVIDGKTEIEIMNEIINICDL